MQLAPFVRRSWDTVVIFSVSRCSVSFIGVVHDFTVKFELQISLIVLSNMFCHCRQWVKTINPALSQLYSNCSKACLFVISQGLGNHRATCNLTLNLVPTFTNLPQIEMDSWNSCKSKLSQFYRALSYVLQTSDLFAVPYYATQDPPDAHYHSTCVLFLRLPLDTIVILCWSDLCRVCAIHAWDTVLASLQSDMKLCSHESAFAGVPCSNCKFGQLRFQLCFIEVVASEWTTTDAGYRSYSQNKNMFFGYKLALTIDESSQGTRNKCRTAVLHLARKLVCLCFPEGWDSHKFWHVSWHYDRLRNSTTCEFCNGLMGLSPGWVELASSWFPVSMLRVRTYTRRVTSSVPSIDMSMFMSRRSRLACTRQ